MPPIAILTQSYPDSMYKTTPNNTRAVSFLWQLGPALSTAIFLVLEGSCIENQEARRELTLRKVAFIAVKALH